MKRNIIIDFFSRMQNDNNDTPVKDNFLDEYIFAMSTKTPWFANIGISFIA